MKDLVRCQIVFSSFPDMKKFLNILIKESIKNASNGDDSEFSILEIKSKLQSEIRNVTIVVSYFRIIGELQLQFKEICLPEDKFLRHWLYEIERIYCDNIITLE